MKLNSSVGRIILITLAAGLVLCTAVCGYFVYLYPNVYRGSRLLGRDLGGLSKDELKAYVSTLPAYDGKKALAFMFGEEPFEIALSELGASVDIDKTADAVYSYGREGNFFERLQKSIGLAPYEDHRPAYSLDVGLAKELLTEKAESLKTEFSDSYYKMEGLNLIISKGTKGLAFDPASCAQMIEEQASSGEFQPIIVPMELKEPKPLDIGAIISELTVQPADARYEGDGKGGIIIIPHTIGLTFDRKALETAVSVASGEVTFPSEPYMPDITEEKIHAELFGDVLADTITYLNMYNRPRTKNIWIAAQMTNGVILMPGDTFSFNRVVGERTYEKGYRDASVYTRNGNEEGLAGGICQLSSTIHMSAIRANLEIVQRSNHAYTVPYCPPGEDATVYWGAIDFRFKNIYDYPIKIETIQEKDYVICRIYGKKDLRPEVKIEHKTLSTSGYSTKTVIDPTLAPGKTKVDQEGHIGVSSETYRVLYKNGVEIYRELLNRSKYVPMTKIVLVGPEPELPVDPAQPPVQPPDPTQPSDPVEPPAEDTDPIIPPPDPFDQLQDLIELD